MPSATRAAMGVSAYQLRLSLPCFRPGKLPGNQRLEMAFRWKSHLQLFLILRGRGRGHKRKVYLACSGVRSVLIPAKIGLLHNH